MPHHVVEGVLELLVGDADSDLYVPYQEIIV